MSSNKITLKELLFFVFIEKITEGRGIVTDFIAALD